MHQQSYGANGRHVQENSAGKRGVKMQDLSIAMGNKACQIENRLATASSFPQCVKKGMETCL